MDKKRYVYTGERRSFEFDGHQVVVQRIKAAEDFDVYALKRIYVYDNKNECMSITEVVYVEHIKKDQLGGYIQCDDNLQKNAWVSEGMVFDGAVVTDNSWVGGERTIICGPVQICDDTKVIIFKEDFDKYSDRITVGGNLKICGRSKIIAPVYGQGVIKNLLVNEPKTIRPRTSSKTAGIPVQVECTIGDKKVASSFVL